MPRPRQPCGTLAAYWHHIRAQETACVPCADAYNQAREDRRLAPQRRAVLAEAVYTTTPRRGMQGARQRAILRGELLTFEALIVALVPGLLAVDWWRARRRP